MLRTALSIAGSDPSGGAGIQADLKTFLDSGVYGMSVITALTAQNTNTVSGIFSVSPAFIQEQLRTLFADLPVHAVKIGMLADADTIAAVVAGLSDYAGPIVVDPVMISTSGHRLLQPDAIDALRARLVPRATVVTPNLPEADLLLDGADPQAWAEQIGVAVLIKDGHSSGATVRDVLYRPGLPPRATTHPRRQTRNTHGTGCTLSSAIAAGLAKGQELPAAVEGGIAYVARLIDGSTEHTLGSGKGPLLHGLVGRR
jgi:hydroxymethylpyrimidine/phosphomethylpyrimidine kinase